MSNELLPCPFCGGKAETDASSVSEFYGHEHQDYTIECTKCGADMTVYTHSNKDGTPSKGYEFGCSCCNDIPAAARKKWNTRPQQITSAGYVMVKGLADALRHVKKELDEDCCEDIDYAQVSSALAVFDQFAAAPKAEPVQGPVAVCRDGYGTIDWYRVPSGGTKLYAAPQPVSDDARDAARYRWLRDRMRVRKMQAMDGSARPALVMRVGFGFLDITTDPYSGWLDIRSFDEQREKLDAAIDAAMAGGGE